MGSQPATAPIYRARAVSRSFGGVQALTDVDLDVWPGEVHALLGANGAGKSTLAKVLVGAVSPTSGTLEIDGRPVAYDGPEQASRDGVAIVSQELELFPDLDVLENLFLRREARRAGVFDRAAMRARAQPVMQAVGLDVDLDRPLGSLRLAEQQLTEIARQLLTEPRILLLDEPTSALRAAETRRLLDVVRRLRDRGVAIIYVSHFLADVFAIADRITVLRSGRVAVGGRARTQMTISDAVQEMLGEAAQPAPRPAAPARTPTSGSGPLRASGIAVGQRLAPLDLEAHPGEIVGLAGLEGSGVEALMQVLFGQTRPSEGTVVLPSGAGAPRSITEAVRAGVAYVPADRKATGLLLEQSVAENVTSVSAGPLRRMGRLPRPRSLEERAEHWARRLGITGARPDLRVGDLSGGNQQKVVLAKWLETDPALVLLDDPSRGVDVGAKVEMHRIVRQMAEQHRVVLYTSSDYEEMAELCDRALLFVAGRQAGELSGDALTERGLLEGINAGVVAA